MDHTPTVEPIDPAHLWQRAKAALEVAGPPQWPSPEPGGEDETLVFLEGDEPTWVLAPLSAVADGERDPTTFGQGFGRDENADEAASGFEHDPDGEEAAAFGGEPHSGDDHHDDHNGHCGCDDGPDVVAVSADMAAELIKSHLRTWLAERAWQIQLSLTKGRPTWRLSDCLSFAEGGGDRLDDDYPQGADELDVLCASVLTVGGAGK